MMFQKLILPLLMLGLFAQSSQAQNSKFANEWKQIEALENQSKLKDALVIVESILEKSGKEKLLAEQYKSLLYTFKYRMILEEESEKSIEADLKNRISKATTAEEKALLEMLLADAYFNYYQAKSYEILDRTNSEVKSDNFMLWDAQQFVSEIRKGYLSALSASESLKKIPIESISSLVIGDKNQFSTLPTLYDLLAYKAFSFFSSDNSRLTEVKDVFEFNDPVLFGTDDQFNSQKLQHSDSLSFPLLALQVIQDWTSARAKDGTPLLKADIHLQRIRFVLGQYSGEEREALFENALVRYLATTPEKDIQARYKYELASLWYQQSQSAVTKKTLPEIRKFCAEVVSTYPKTMGGNNCAAIIQQIDSKSLSLKMEEAIVPTQDFKAFIQYKNLVSIQYRIIELKDNQTFPYEDKMANKWTQIKKSKLIRSGTIALSGSEDHLEHALESAFTALPVGKYALVLHTSNIEKSPEEATLAMATFWSTSLSVTASESDNLYSILVRDRVSGKPESGVQVKIWIHHYDYNARKTEKKLISTLITNEKGEAQWKWQQERNGFSTWISLQKGKDRYETAQQYIYPQNAVVAETKDWQTRVHLFTDRAIYRPGQTVFFKGIVTQQLEAQHKAGVDFPITIILRDVNWQEIAQFSYTTNEFGSFSGFFEAPKGGLAGIHHLETPFGTTFIRVEEYKRPNFEVNTLPVEGEFKFKDTITVKGKAIAFSGAPIGSSKVKYIVKRAGYYPWWWGWSRKMWPPVSTDEKIIATGTTQTNAQGEFELSFVAIQGKKGDIADAFNQYEISIDVTDVNGETQSANGSVRVGTVSINPNIDIPEVWQKGKNINANASVKNLQDQNSSAEMALNIFTLNTPNQPKKTRYWEAPDQFNLSKSQHDARFPFDLYAKEDDISTLPIQKSVWTKTVNISGDSILKILPSNLAVGTYLLQANVKASNGDTVLLKKYFEVREDIAISTKPDFVVLHIDKNTAQPGDTVIISFSSALKETQVNVRLSHQQKVLEQKTITLNNGVYRWNFVIDSSMLGGLELSYDAVAQNRIFRGYKAIEIPFKPLNQLTYHWKTFRNKLEPGAKENWEMQIKGENGEKVMAELLATLYDASLDQFVAHDYQFDVSKPSYIGYYRSFFDFSSFRDVNAQQYTGKSFSPSPTFQGIQYPGLNDFGFQFAQNRYRYYYRNASGIKSVQRMDAMASAPPALMESEMVQESAGMGDDAKQKAEEVEAPKDNAAATEKPSVKSPQIRKNFQETAFFFPQLKTDSEGNVSLSFTMPDALTRWNLLGLAHQKDLQYTLIKEQVTTSKDLMITPNKMRFLRMGDTLIIKARISNLTDQEMNGIAELQFRDATTNELITDKMMMSTYNIEFAAAPQSSTFAQWAFAVPHDLEGIIYEISATAGTFTDAETDVIPVLENRMLLTESLPIFINKKGKHLFELEKLSKNTSKTLQTQSLVFEYTSHPVWYALMALPYLNEHDNESSTRLFERWYSHTMAAYILKQIPQSKQLLEAWKKEGNLKSALEKNPELKSVVLEATPWLRDAKSETEQMNQLTQLFNDAENKALQEDLINKIKQLQTPNGGLSWFPGMPDNRYITQYVLNGIGHLQHLGALNWKENPALETLSNSMLRYLDQRIVEDLVNIKRADSNYLKNDHLDYLQSHYLYTRSFYVGQKVENSSEEAFKYFLQQAEKYAISKDMYRKGMLALALHRFEKPLVSKSLVEALRQTSITSKTEGMYWKDNSAGSYWYQSSIQNQALMVEVFNEIAKDDKTVSALQTWLLRQKQTSRWENPRATAQACYALLLSGGKWTEVAQNDVISVGKISMKDEETVEGTGYFKKSWDAKQVVPTMAKVEVTKKQNNPSWGALYWQYWEDMDKISSASNDLEIKRTVYKVAQTDAGEVLQVVKAGNELFVGDKLRIKLEIISKRDLEFVHLSDSRGSGMEPTDVLSGYQVESGLWFYKTTGDAATHWFIDRLGKGTYSLEYTAFAAAAGIYTSGIAQGECLYAPEFRAHAVGNKISVKP